MSRRHNLGSAGLAICLGLVASPPTRAQQAGLYVGTTSQGGFVEVYVQPDETGQLLMSVFGAGYVATCGVGAPLRAGWYVFADTPLSTQPAPFEMRADFLYEAVVAQFNAAGDTVFGSLQAVLPAFAARGPKTTGTTACATGSLSYTATFQSPLSSDATAPHRGMQPVGSAKRAVGLASALVERALP